MTTRASAIIADAKREYLQDPLARYKRRQVRELHRLIEIDGTKLGRDGEAAVSLQIDRLEAEIYA